MTKKKQRKEKFTKKIAKIYLIAQPCQGRSLFQIKLGQKLKVSTLTYFYLHLWRAQ